MTSRLFAPLHGLRARLMLLVSVALAPMLVQALHELDQEYALNVAHARAGLLEAVRQAAAEHAARVESARRRLAALAGQTAVRGALAPACEQALTAMRDHAPEYLDLVVSAPDGRVVCSALPPGSAAEGAAGFRRADGRPAPETTTLQVAVSHPREPTEQDSNAPVSNTPPSGDWVSDARASDRWSAHDRAADGRAAHGWAPVPRAPNAWRPAYWPVGGVYDRPVVHLSHRERAPDGRVAFIVGAALDLDWLARRVGQTLTPDGASLALLDATGRTLARTAAWPSAGAGWVLNARAGPWDLTDRDGRSWVMATTRMGDGAPARLLSLAVPTGTLYAPVERARRRDAATLAAVLTLALGTAWFGAGFYLKRRVRPLLGAIGRMDAGDFSARAGVTGGDELGTLARAFDGIAGGLQRRECERDAGLSRFEELVDSLDGVVWEADAQTWKLSYISRRVEMVLGLSVEECLASANFWAEVIHPDDLQRVFEDCEAAVARCETHELEYRIITRGGRELWAHEIITVHPEGSRPVLLRGLLRDVSARKRVEAELTAVSAQITTLVTNLPSGVALETPDRLLQLANPALCEMMSGGPGDAPAGPLELVGHHCREICNTVATRFEGDPEAFVARVEAVTAAARPVHGEKLVLKDGRVFERDYVPVLDGERLTGHLWHYRDVTERHAAMKEIETLAYYDSLTGLPNRRLLADLLTRTVAETQRHGQLLAVLFLDLDRFKTVNDSLGHGVGDRLLQAAAQRLKDCVRAEDTVARMGGDEFVVVLKGLQRPDDAGRTARQILAAFARPLRADGHDLTMSTSVGIALHPYDGAEADGLIRSADAAMYAAKSAGRGNYRFFRPEMNARALELLQMESRLRRALACDEFVLHYQPQYRLDDGRLTGMEALIRWQEPEWGLVSPARFIPIAEEAGLIREIGEWALREACRQNRAWQDAGLPHVPVAVNLSAIQFRQPGLAARVASILRDTGLAPDDLELELTESALMLPEDVMLERMQALGRVGVRLAIDDFGTGYSSLSYLKRFRLDKLKIDQAFVRDVCHDLDDAAIVCAVIGMAQNLRLTVIAEGVESAEQLAFLRSHGCDQVQGFFLGRPLPAEEMEGRLRSEAAQDLAEAAALRDSVPVTPGS